MTYTTQLTAAQVQTAQYQAQSIADSATTVIGSNKFVFFAAFDGTNNDRSNPALAGDTQSTNIGVLEQLVFRGNASNGNVQTGYIPFGYNPDVNPVEIIPESLLFAVSGGVKARFLDNRLEINVEGFHYGYKNFQAIQFITAVGRSTVLKAQKATIHGVDLSVRARVTPTTQINGSFVM